MGFNNGPKLVTEGLDLLIDAADPQSYPGTGTVWTDLRSGTTGSLTGSVSYTSEFYGGLTFSDSSSAVIFPGSTANYGTGSFTVEMAFKPSYIEGKHYLMSKNSGSFPNWSIYLSGSNNEGKLWSEFNIDASVSCSYSSSTVFQTGSVYQVDVILAPGLSGSGITVDGSTEGGILGNGGGSLTTTGSLFVGNYSQDNTQNFSGSIYTIKTYSTTGFTLPAINFNATATRLSKQPIPQEGLKVFELLVVAGGGSGGGFGGGGGGAGGLQYFSNFSPTLGISQVIIGAGASTVFGFGGTGARGQNSVFSGVTSIGGGGGGQSATTGGSGGGGAAYAAPYPGAAGTLNQGNSGGDGTIAGAGGGGGAGTLGGTGTRAGGSGSYIASFAAIGGSPAGWFAGGGAGMVSSNVDSGIGGIGGGGNAGRSGSANTGGGGGATFSAASIGGSGIVAIRYSGTPIALGGEITQSEGYTYHVYRTVGTSSFTIF
jgi:hypothetical protein